MKFLHQFAAILRVAGQIKVRPLAQLYRVAEQIEHGDELREHEHLVPLLHQWIEQVQQRGDLRAFGLAEFSVHEPGVTANLPQPQQRRENVESLVVELLVRFEAKDELAGALEFGAIERALLTFHYAQQVLLDAVGQVLRDLHFCAPQQEWSHARGQSAAGERVILRVEAAEKMRPVAQRAGHGEGENAPEIQQTVFNGRAGEREAMLGLQRAGRLRGLRVGIFDVLSFVKNRRKPPHLPDGGPEEAQLRVIDDDEVGAFARGTEFFGRFALPDADAQAGIKSLRLGAPVVGDGFWADDEAGKRGGGRPACRGRRHLAARNAARILHVSRNFSGIRSGKALAAGQGSRRHIPQPCEPCQRLQRLAQAHVVRKHAAEAVLREVGKKVIAIRLIRPHFGADVLRQCGRDAGFQFADAALNFLDVCGREEFLRGLISQLQRMETLRFRGKIPRVEADPGELLVLLGREFELEPPPAFLAQTHIAAARVEQKL